MTRKQIWIQKIKEFFIEVSVLFFFTLSCLLVYYSQQVRDEKGGYGFHPLTIILIGFCVFSGIASMIVAYNIITNINKLRKYNYAIIKVPDEFKTPIQQYLLFFKDFVKLSKNLDINFEAFKTNEGIAIRVENSKSFRKETFQKWFQEYLYYLKKNENENFEFEELKVVSHRNNLLIQRLNLEINHLKTNIQFLNEKNELKTSESKFLKEITFKLLEDRSGKIGQKLILSGSTNDSSIVTDQENLRYRLKEKIAKNKIDDTLLELLQLTKTKKELHNQIILLNNQHNESKKKYTNNLMPEYAYIIVRNKITNAIIQIIDEL